MASLFSRCVTETPNSDRSCVSVSDLGKMLKEIENARQISACCSEPSKRPSEKIFSDKCELLYEYMRISRVSQKGNVSSSIGVAVCVRSSFHSLFVPHTVLCLLPPPSPPASLSALSCHLVPLFRQGVKQLRVHGLMPRHTSLETQDENHPTHPLADPLCSEARIEELMSLSKHRSDPFRPVSL